ncbi:MAG: AAA family ATPase [Candidatus Micrarchaeaceae archaeon]|jgi:adenylate kinase
MTNKIVFVCGSPGAGKSTLVNRLAKNKNYKVLNAGTLMMDFAVKKKYVKNRDELRFLSNKKVSSLRAEFLMEISKINGNVILDSHATVQQNGRYLPGITAQDVKYLKGLVGFVYIDSVTGDILKRRVDDRTRRRENERADLIDVQRLINISIISAYSTDFNIPLYVVFNQQGKLAQSMKQITSHMKDAFGV